MITLYGIPNCDSVKKARAWLKLQQLAHEFHDFKKQGLSAEKLASWEKTVGWEALLNRRGTTWRQLDPQLQTATTDAASAQAVMLANTSAIKRPVVEWNGDVLVGFDAQSWSTRL